MGSVAVTSLALVARCERQAKLHADGVPVGLRGDVDRTFGRLVHASLAAAVDELPIHAGAGRQRPEVLQRRAYEALWRAAFPSLLRELGGSTAEALQRVDGVLRALSVLLGALAGRGRPSLQAEVPVALELDGLGVGGALDLLCEGEETRFALELKTFPAAPPDPAAIAQLGLYGLALAARGGLVPALLHVTADELALVRPPPMRREGAQALAGRWLALEAGALPARAEAATCVRCTAQAACWARWGRTIGEDAEPTSKPLRRAPPGEQAPSRAKSLTIGADRTGAPIQLPVEDLRRHVAIFGQSGSGKTHLARVLIEEALAAGLPALVLDIAGDLAPLGQQARAGVEARVLTPGSGGLSLDPLTLPSPALDAQSFLRATHAVALAVAGLARPTKALREGAVAALERLLTDAARSGRAPRLAELADELAGERELLSRAQAEGLARRLRSRTIGEAGALWAGGAGLSIDELVTPRTAGAVPCTVLALHELPDDLRHDAIAVVLSRLYGWMMSAPQAPAARLLLFVDEAGRLLPPENKPHPPGRDVLLALLQEGRKYGVCVVLAAQSFSSVDYKAFDQASTRLVGRMAAAQNRAKLREWMGGRLPPELLAEVGGLRHEFLIDAPDRFDQVRTVRARAVRA